MTKVRAGRGLQEAACKWKGEFAEMAGQPERRVVGPQRNTLRTVTFVERFFAAEGSKS